MKSKPTLPWMTLIMMISFASVNAVLFTPALPDIATFFAISEEIAQYSISLFLVGYALGQLIYGPLANRFGRKQALYIGIGLQIFASLGCVLSGGLHYYPLLVLSRLLLALGSGVGLKMTFTLVNECYEPKVASQKISYLLLAFAITPGLAVALGGFLNTHFGWMSCFIAGAIYGAILLVFVAKMPNVEIQLDRQALQWSHLRKAYSLQFSNKQLLAGGLLMGGSTCFVYVFAAIAPFIAINIMGMSSEQYGLANIIPSFGLIIGSLACAYLVKRHPIKFLILVGLMICAFGAILMTIAVGFSLPVLLSIFLPMCVIYIGLSLVMSNASSLAMSLVNDKAHGSAVMNFINMGAATVVVLGLGWFVTKPMLLPLVYFVLCVAMVPMYRWLVK